MYSENIKLKKEIIMENKKSFGGYVKAKRIEAGLTQKAFADVLYVTESAVSKWERGLSYPDITLIMEICRVLNISEHELLTASEDMQTRRQEKLAQRYLSLIKRIKIAQIILYAIPLITCFIVNLATGGGLSWFFIVLTALAVSASLTLLPVFAEKKRGLVTLAGFTASLIALLAVCRIYAGGNWLTVTLISVIFGLSVIFLPFVLRNVNLPSPLHRHKAALCLGLNTLLLFVLLFVSDVFTSGGWFISRAVPITAFWLILPWGFTLIIRYTRINAFFKTAGCLALSSVIYFLMRGFTEIIFGEAAGFGFRFNFSNWSNIEIINYNIDAIIFFALAGLAVVFSVVGAVREIGKNKTPLSQN